jgi:hypothetical protein
MVHLRALVCVALLATLIACTDNFVEDLGYAITNDLDRSVRLTQVFEGEESELPLQSDGVDLDPGETKYIGTRGDPDSGCADRTLVARDLETAEQLAAITPPLCPRDQFLLSDYRTGP